MKDQIIINQTCKQGGFLMDLSNFINQYDFWVRLLAVVIFALCVMVPLTIKLFKKPKSKEEIASSAPKQELTQVDYQMILDSMLLFGIINSRQYNEYLQNGLPYFKSENYDV